MKRLVRRLLKAIKNGSKVSTTNSKHKMGLFMIAPKSIILLSKWLKTNDNLSMKSNRKRLFTKDYTTSPNKNKKVDKTLKIHTKTQMLKLGMPMFRAWIDIKDQAANHQSQVVQTTVKNFINGG